MPFTWGCCSYASLDLLLISQHVYDSRCPPSHSPDDHFCTGDCGCPYQAPLAPIGLAPCDTARNLFMPLDKSLIVWLCFRNDFVSFFIESDSSPYFACADKRRPFDCYGASSGWNFIDMLWQRYDQSNHTVWSSLFCAGLSMHYLPFLRCACIFTTAGA